MLTPVKTGGPLLLWLVFWAGRNIQETLNPAFEFVQSQWGGVSVCYRAVQP